MSVIKYNNTTCASKPTFGLVLKVRQKTIHELSLCMVVIVIGVMLHYLALGRFFFVKSAREILKGIPHVAITLTTLKAEKVT